MFKIFCNSLLVTTWKYVNEICREEGDLLIDWGDIVVQDTDNESQGRETPNDALSIDNCISPSTIDSKYYT